MGFLCRSEAEDIWPHRSLPRGMAKVALDSGLDALDRQVRSQVGQFESENIADVLEQLVGIVAAGQEAEGLPIRPYRIEGAKVIVEGRHGSLGHHGPSDWLSLGSPPLPDPAP